MRIAVLPIILSSLICMETFAQTNDPDDAQLQAELGELRRKTGLMGQRVEALDKAMDQRTIWSVIPKDRAREVNVIELQRVTLPIGATKLQVEVYIARIIEISKPQYTFSLSDPQTMMLSKVGPRHVDLLLARLAEQPFYIKAAVSSVADERSKPLVLAKLAMHPELIDIVLEQKWLEDAKPVILEKLSERPESLPTAWIWAAAQFKEPATYPDLAEYLARGRNPLDTYESIRDLPGIDLAPAVQRLLERGQQDALLMGETARVAVNFGHKKALDILMRAVQGDQVAAASILYPRTVVLQHIDFRGTREQIIDWYKKNADKLEFDPATKKFHLPKAGI